MEKNKFMVVLLQLGYPLLLFLGLCEGVITLSSITIRPRGKQKVIQLKS